MLGLMRVKIAPRGSSYRILFHLILIPAFLLPFVFILTVVVTLEEVDSLLSLPVSLLSGFVSYASRSQPQEVEKVGDEEGAKMIERDYEE
ncbi:uncharacterized protein A4U43_C01F34420 [Asparagus officinalis]|uniref:Uncharacterized protein n=1 Tax=Asparagus officinalis TaxID=4686 RepID=A0A5P1FV84_ASPOF|nr:uncharacterized protein A4U43_C01F34420 [Asparagus officinalis]